MKRRKHSVLTFFALIALFCLTACQSLSSSETRGISDTPEVVSDTPQTSPNAPSAPRPTAPTDEPTHSDIVSASALPDSEAPPESAFPPNADTSAPSAVTPSAPPVKASEAPSAKPTALPSTAPKPSTTPKPVTPPVSSPSPATSLGVTVSISTPDFVWPTVTIENAAGIQTAYDALAWACRELNLTVSVRGGSSTLYIEAIGPYRERDLGPLSGWLFWVNGEKSSVSAGAYPVFPGDAVSFVFVEDFTKV